MSEAIRAMREDDKAALYVMWVAAWREVYPDIDFEARQGWFAEHLASLISGGAHAFVAESSAALVGFMTVNRADNYIDQIAVAPQHRGGGLAARLLAKAREISPDRLALFVNKDNARALRFYEREGFARTAEGVNPQSGRAYWEMEWRRAQDA